MSLHAIADRYAKSLLSLAAERSELEPVMDDVKALREAFESADLKNAIQSPIIKASKKIAILKRVFGAQFKPLTQQFVDKLILKGRHQAIPAILDAFVEKYNHHHGILHVTLTTMPNLGSKALDSIKQALPGIIGEEAKLDIEHLTDPSLIGGFIVQYGDRRFDASIKHDLERYKKAFS